MNRPDAELESTLGRYQQELVRWNRQINLVSRQDTLHRVALLIGQSKRAWRRLYEAELSAWPGADRFSYFDLGSGGGLPGFVWHLLQANHFEAASTTLVEPREKRAWFLERLRRLAPSSDLNVWNGRWGDSFGQRGSFGNTLVSLKALHLNDLEVLDGLSHSHDLGDFEGVARVVVARFYPFDQVWTSALKAGLSPLGQATALGGLRFEPCGNRILGPGEQNPQEAALVLTIYQATANRP